MELCLQINPCDNVAVALSRKLRPDERVLGIQVREEVPVGHKIALTAISAGEDVIKYGFPIGKAKCDIAPGQWVHSHNLATGLEGLREYRYSPAFREPGRTAPHDFWGYRRSDGRVGIRNEVWIIPTVGCVNAVAKAIEDGVGIPVGVDGVFAYRHPYGCSQLGDDQLYTLKALTGLARHPNAGGVLVVGLGCENSGIGELKKVLGPYDETRLRFLNCQDAGDEVAEGAAIVGELCALASADKREPSDASELVVGLKCGGSDGFSGITANALVGAFSDRLIAQGGATILTEVPEMFGAEHLLMARCRNENVFEQTVELINSCKSYFLGYGQPVGENPSPGNREGGITTLEEKSLGCVQKGGTAPVEDVLDYGQQVRSRGLSLLQGPGNDLVATCGLAASGAHLILFTTGRGTPLGCPVPTLKISSNSQLADRKSHWIDFDAGPLLDGAPMEKLAENLLELVLAVASGEKNAKAEALDKRDFTIFKDGVIL